MTLVTTGKWDAKAFTNTEQQMCGFVLSAKVLPIDFVVNKWEKIEELTVRWFTFKNRKEMHLVEGYGISEWLVVAREPPGKWRTQP